MHTLAGIVCFGNVGCSPFLLGFCGERDVAVSFLDEQGRFLARVVGPVSGNVLLRREQYRKADDSAFSAQTARAFLSGKVAGCRNVLSRALRDHSGKIDADQVKQAADHLGASLRRLQEKLDLDAVRGVEEGDAAHVYFSSFDHLILRNKEDFFFHEHDVRSALECVGLDPAVGFLHRDRPGRQGLALDMLEEFRPFADRIALSLINLGQLQAKDFVVSASGGVRMQDEARKTLLTTYQERKQEVLEHPFLSEKMPLGLFFHTQALLLARFLRGDLDGYPPVMFG